MKNFTYYFLMVWAIIAVINIGLEIGHAGKSEKKEVVHGVGRLIWSVLWAILLVLAFLYLPGRN